MLELLPQLFTAVSLLSVSKIKVGSIRVIFETAQHGADFHKAAK